MYFNISKPSLHNSDYLVSQPEQLCILSQLTLPILAIVFVFLAVIQCTTVIAAELARQNF